MESKTRSPVGVSGKNSSHLRIVLVGRPPQHPGDQDLALGALAGAVKQPQGILHRIRLLRHQLIHGAANIQVGDGHLLGIEVLTDLPKNVVIAGFRKIRHHDFLSVSLRLCAGKAELLRRP